MRVIFTIENNKSIMSRVSKDSDFDNIQVRNGVKLDPSTDPKKPNTIWIDSSNNLFLNNVSGTASQIQTGSGSAQSGRVIIPLTTAQSFNTTTAFTNLTDFQATLPEVGTYWVHCRITISKTGTLNGDTTGRFTLDDTPISDSDFFLSSPTIFDNVVNISEIVTTTSTNQIVRIQAEYTGTTGFVVFVNNNAKNRNKLLFFK